MNTNTELWMRRGAIALLSLSLISCDEDTLLEVPDPDVATPESVQDKAALPAVLAGALGDYMVAYNGTGDGQVSMTGLFTDELIWAETFPTRFEVDVRSITNVNGTTEGVFRNLHRARISAFRAADGYARLDTSTVNRALWAEALNLEGMSYIHFGENYCNGVPFSLLLPNGTYQYGGPISNDSMFVLAIARFDSTISILGVLATTAANTQRNFARIGRARAMVDRAKTATLAADMAAAAAVAALVPAGASYSINHSQNSSRQNNGLFTLVYDGRRFGVGQLEGTNGLPFQADAAGGDNRVPNARLTGSQATGFDGITPLFSEQKYAIRDAAIVVANATEARLIEAEADLAQAVPTGSWLTTLNALRTANTPPLANLVDPGTAVGRQNMLFKERAYWMWLTAHRLGDMRRLVRQYGRTATTVFPTGNYFKGGLFGSDVNFPIPFDEKNNPSFVECTDRNP